jgi:hypothetical protein
MKRVLLFASIIGLFTLTTMDLQARHRGNYQPRLSRSGISLALHGNIPIFNQYGRYAQYPNYRRHAQYPNCRGRRVDGEIRSNERRIRELVERLDRLDRYNGNYGEIRRLEQEINWLERRNDYLRSRLY